MPKFKVEVVVEAKSKADAKRAILRRVNPEQTYGPVEIINTYIPLGVFKDRVYKLNIDSGSVYGIPLSVIGIRSDTPAVYSRLKSLEWQRASESSYVITVSDWVGRSINLGFSPSDTYKLLYQKVEKQKAVKAKTTHQYKGFYYARVSTPWGAKYVASRSVDNLTDDNADYSRKTKEQLFRAIDEA